MEKMSTRSLKNLISWLISKGATKISFNGLEVEFKGHNEDSTSHKLTDTNESFLEENIKREEEADLYWSS